MRISRSLLGLAAAALLFSALPARAEEPAQGIAKVDVTVDVLPTGAGDGKVVLDFAPMTYQFVKRLVPEPSRLLMDLGMRRGNIELASGTSARYDDATTDAVLDLKQVNAARNLGDGRWEIPVDPAFEFINDKVDGDRPTFFFYQFGTYTRPAGDDISFRGQFRFRLPAGATETGWDGGKHLIHYRITRAEGTGPAKLAMELDVKPRLMTAIYKVYGRDQDFANMWLAKARLTNAGTSVIKDVRVRYKVEGYSEWSPWDRFPEVVPGQTLVSRYHPVLEAKISRLQSATPAQILAEWSYTDLAGQTKTDSDGRKVTLLGGHDLVLQGTSDAQQSARYVENVTNAPFVSAWVTPDDLPVKEFSAMASRLAKGVGAGQSDQSTVDVLNAIYDLWLHNGFTYQHPPGLLDRSVSFNEMFVQNVKFPRDVLRDKSGTCIDVAICYAAMANSLGIRPYLALRPGHCFPVFELPGSGRMLAVEATGATRGGVVDGGGVIPFSKAVELAMGDLDKQRRSGTLILVDVQSMWTRGVTSPDLESLPANILKEWGLSTGPATEKPATDRPQPETPPAEETPPEAPPAAEQEDPYLGRWTMTIEERLAATGQVVRYPVVLTIAQDGDGYKAGTEAEVEVPVQGGTATFRVLQVLAGERSEEGVLILKGTSKVIQNVATGQSSAMGPDTLVAVVRGGALVGKATSDGNTWLEFTMQRAR